MKRLAVSASALKCIALLAMLVDHLWATIVPGNLWMTCFGRIAFPIFAFQIAEGYQFTSNYIQYRNRLLIFALISEIPFDLMIIGSPFFPFHQNVLFTLLLGLIAIHTLDDFISTPDWQKKSIHILKLCLIFIGSYLLFPDYGTMGVMTVVLFHLFRDQKHAWAGQLAGMVVLNILTAEGQLFWVSLGSFSTEIPLQAFALLALIPIWLYNRKKGRGGKLLKWGTYVFYPLHMITLHLLRNFF